MIQKAALVFSLTFFVFTNYAQTTSQRYMGDDTNLRSCVLWNDSTIYATIERHGHQLSVYRFELKMLCYGVYESKQIFIATNPISLKQFNPNLALGKTYWWTLIKSDQCEGDQFIYYHRGDF